MVTKSGEQLGRLGRKRLKGRVRTVFKYCGWTIDTKKKKLDLVFFYLEKYPS